MPRRLLRGTHVLTHVLGCATGEQVGWTALLSAADRGHTDIVQLLLDHGADIELCEDVSTGLLRGRVY